MTTERCGELLQNVVGYLSEAVYRGDLYRVLTRTCGMTEEELAELGLVFDEEEKEDWT